MSNRKKILVVGTGSAGKRHGRNLRELGCAISFVDPRQDRLSEAAEEGAVGNGYTVLAQALEDQRWDGVVIASPANFHVEQVLEVIASQTCPVLSEKPLSIDTASAVRLKAHSDRILLGYTYRWWPPLEEYRRLLHHNAIGRVRNMRFIMSAHLADWHPWERYQDFFMAKKALGGGALLDESHFIDLMLWFLGPADEVFSWVDKISNLEIETDDNVDILVRYRSGTQVNLHLDLIGRPHDRSITAVGEEGTLVYSYEDNAVMHGTQGEKTWDIQRFDCERNDMFLGVAREFLAMIGGNLEEKRCTIEDGIAALKIVDACRISSAEGRVVALR